MPSPDWPAPVVDERIDADVALPGSKSLTNRFLVLAALANDTSRLRRPLRSRDTLLMAEALRSLGARVEDGAPDPSGSPDWIVTPATLSGDVSIDCGLAGTVMRFLPPVAALCSGAVAFDGDEQARIRPMAPVLESLRALGATIDDGGRGTLPFTVHGTGRMPGGTVTLDASASSQFVSALLLAGPRYEQGVTVRHVGPPVPSEPHIEMTVETLRDAGAIVDDAEPDVWRVEPSEINAVDVQVEPDLSNAAPFLAAALVTGGRVTVPGWPQHTTQAGDAIRDILDAMGADVSLAREGLTVTGTGEVSGVDVDLHDASELTPVVAAIAALADSPSIIRGVAHIRGHETDRLAALARELGALGTEVAETDDGLRIRPRPLHGGLFRTYDDHRMAMAGAVLGLRVPGLVVEDVATVGKTLPDFVGLWQSMVGRSRPDSNASPARRASRATGLAAHEPQGQRLRRERRPGPAQPAWLATAHQGPSRPRGRRPGLRHRRRPRPLHHRRPRGGRRRKMPERVVVAMKARELGRKGIVVGDDVELVGDTSGSPDALARIVRLSPRRSVLRRTADDTDPVERVIVANADQLVIVSALADPEPRPRMIDRCLVAAYDAGLDPLLVLTKADLKDPAEFLRRLRPARGALRGDLDRGRRVRRAGSVAGQADWPGQRLRRPLRRRQVHPGQRPRAGGPPRHRHRQRRDRARAAHLELGGRAAPAGRPGLGHRHPRRALLRPRPRRPRPDHRPLPRPRARDHHVPPRLLPRRGGVRPRRLGRLRSGRSRRRLPAGVAAPAAAGTLRRVRRLRAPRRPRVEGALPRGL